MRMLSLLPLYLLLGCPDPNASSSGMETTTTASSGTDPQATTGSQETDPSAARLNCVEGDTNCVTIAGSMVYDGTPNGSIRLDVQKVRKGSAPMLVHTLEMQSVDEFSFDAPKGYNDSKIAFRIPLSCCSPSGGLHTFTDISNCFCIFGNWEWRVAVGVAECFLTRADAGFWVGPPFST